MDPKKWYTSKTIWANAAALVGAVGAWAQAGFHAADLTTYIFPAGLAVLNVILRIVTKQPID